MSFPNYLLPKKGYKKINTDLINLKCFYLTRYTPDRNYYDPPDSTNLKLSYISEQSAWMGDLSLSLLGTFKHTNNAISITKGSSYSDFWDEKSTVPAPDTTQYIIDHNKGCYFLSVKSVHGHQVPSEHPLQNDFNITCKVVHKPANWNFWHFQFQWENEDGIIDVKVNRKMTKSMQTTSRVIMKKFTFCKVPPYKSTPKYLYKGPNVGDTICLFLNYTYYFVRYPLLKLIDAVR